MSLARNSPQLEGEKKEYGEGGGNEQGGDERGEEEGAGRKAKDGIADGFRGVLKGGDGREEIRGSVCAEDGKKRKKKDSRKEKDEEGDTLVSSCLQLAGISN